MADTQLARLAKPFPDRFIHDNPGGGGRGSYVTHSVVNEKLLAVLGPFSYEIINVYRGTVKNKPELGEVVVGCTARLTVTFDGEGDHAPRTVSVTEVGDCEKPGNWDHDGNRLKDASSDAIKRCAMRLGVGLHLWSQQEFTLSAQLDARPDAVA